MCRGEKLCQQGDCPLPSPHNRLCGGERQEDHACKGQLNVNGWIQLWAGVCDQVAVLRSKLEGCDVSRQGLVCDLSHRDTDRIDSFAHVASKQSSHECKCACKYNIHENDDRRRV